RAATMAATAVTEVRRYPLSLAQQRLWFIDRMSPGSALYNVPAAFSLTGVLHPRWLHQALDGVVARHETLRTTLEEVAGEPVQVVVPKRHQALPAVDLRRLGEGARRAEADRLGAALGARPFDLSRGPLLRTVLLRLAPSEHRLLLCLHHTVSDGWSLGLLGEDMAAFYRAGVLGEAAERPPLELQYGELARQERSRLDDGELRRQLAYWRRQLGESQPVLELPTDRPRPPLLSHAGAVVHAELPATAGPRLQELARRHRTTPFVVLLAGYAALLNRYTGDTDVRIGSPVAGRGQAESEALIGFFVNLLVLRGDLGGDPTFGELVDRLRETVLEAQSNADVPFEKLVEELQPERNRSISPLFQTAFVLQNAPMPPRALAPGLEMSYVDTDSGTAKYDQTLFAIERTPSWRLELEYSTALFDPDTAERFLERYARLLAAAVETPERCLSALPLIPETERRQLAEWGQTALDYPREGTLGELFVAQAARTPDRPALSDRGQTLTYRELEARTAHLAARLRGLGVGPEVVVACCLERSVELVVALIAVARAGGAYLCLDPHHPRAHLAGVLEDSSAAVALTTSAFRHVLPAAGGPALEVVTLDAPSAVRLPREPRGAESAAESAACLFYTSGSTGRPKAVLMPQRALLRLAHLTWPLPISPEDRMAHVSNPAFDAVSYEIWGALLNGAELVVFERDEV
ncbi:MAG: AMP-binding protein, partial [Acidobacteria bacterium]|nr:AMP-binding protein [Acidobacteriota bacterium]